ncbi:MAG: PilT/PilU family type 4a pilus ATPase [Nitrospirota bacterium]|jgi:twitching motility protein PilT
MREITELLKMAVERNASDLHIKVGSQPIMRVHGNLERMESEPRVTAEDIKKICLAVLSPDQMEAFKRKYDLDFAYSVPGMGRFRCNAFVQRGAMGFVFRVVPVKIPSIDELNLPKVLEKISMEPRGLVLVTGTTGSGKTTTLASMVDHINRNRKVNIVTIEDPIEFLHKDNLSIINQREIGTDTTTYSIALRAALRQDPDVLLLGEMRDPETMEIAMTAAETGHLVLSTLHTVDAAETVNRIVSVFPPYQHHQIRLQLSSIVKGVISLRLMPTADGKGRVPAVEVLVSTGLIRECILEPDKTKLIPDVLAKGKSQYGMQTFDQSIFDQYQAGRVSYEEALRWASNVEDFKLKIKGVSSSTEAAEEEVAGKEGPRGGGMKIERFSDRK